MKKSTIFLICVILAMVLLFNFCSDQGDFKEIKDKPEIIAAMNNDKDDKKNFKCDPMIQKMDHT